ncbi:hypothetical protein BZG01_04085 [Labilibaculum manganireducens]|uniref:Uncharacterized protein n=2 Tax=Labilibaculum manganireducens TaxID=1940525 RepID=A0A2N3IDK7_9BACT|nr:hypothetical protein BZG01_04085 [Labilibaculum manganireducens]
MIKSGNLDVGELGINILKNGIMTEHIDYSQIEHAEIKREFRIKNWIITLLIGILLLTISNLWLFDFFSDFEYNPQNYTESIRLPWMILISPIIIGFMSIGIIVSALKRTMILYLFMNKEHRRIHLMDLDKEEKLNELYSFLDDRIVISK